MFALWLFLWVLEACIHSGSCNNNSEKNSFGLCFYSSAEVHFTRYKVHLNAQLSGFSCVQNRRLPQSSKASTMTV